MNCVRYRLTWARATRREHDSRSTDKWLVLKTPIVFVKIDVPWLYYVKTEVRNAITLLPLAQLYYRDAVASSRSTDAEEI